MVFAGWTIESPSLPVGLTHHWLGCAPGRWWWLRAFSGKVSINTHLYRRCFTVRRGHMSHTGSAVACGLGYYALDPWSPRGLPTIAMVAWPGQQVWLGSGLNSRPAGSAGLGALLPWTPRLRLSQYNHLNFLGVGRRPGIGRASASPY